MAEVTPTETYLAFQTEQARLEAELVTLKASNALSDLDTLAADQVKLATIIDRMPALASASEHYERAQRMAALLATQAARWATASAAKASALADVSTRLTSLFEAIDTYTRAHGVQSSVLLALGYSREKRIQFSKAPSSLQQILIVMSQGDRTWLAKVTTFDPEGTEATLPQE